MCVCDASDGQVGDERPVHIVRMRSCLILMYRGTGGVSDATLSRQGQCKETFANTWIIGELKEETRYGKTLEVAVVLFSGGDDM